jgi:hypothetical protein
MQTGHVPVRMKYTATARAWPRQVGQGDSVAGGVQDA